MAKVYRLNNFLQLGNRIISTLVRVGLGPRHTYILKVRGRKSGRIYSTPVQLVEEAGQRWLVSPYGEVAWLRNARAAGQVTLSRGRQTETVRLMEISASQAAPVLKQYITEVPITRPYFDVTPDSSLDSIVKEAPRHPAFLVQPLRG